MAWSVTIHQTRSFPAWKTKVTFCIFFVFDQKRDPKRGPKWGPGGGHSQAVIAKREVFFSVLKKTVDTFSENISAYVSVVPPPPCFFGRKTRGGTTLKSPILKKNFACGGLGKPHFWTFQTCSEKTFFFQDFFQSSCQTCPQIFSFHERRKRLLSFVKSF